VTGLAARLLKRKFSLDTRSAKDLLNVLLELGATPDTAVLTAAVRAIGRLPELRTDPEIRDRLRRLRENLSNRTYSKADRLLLQQIGDLVSDEHRLPIEPGEQWADAALADLNATPADVRRQWIALLQHATTCSATKPSKQWVEEALGQVASIGSDVVWHCARRWFGMIGAAGSREQRVGWTTHTNNTLISPANTDLLIGLAWVISSTGAQQPMILAVAAAAEKAYQKLPYGGCRSEPLANACVRALGSMTSTEAVAALAQLELRVRFPKGRKLIRRMLAEAILGAGLTRSEVEEGMIPDFALAAGTLRLDVGSAKAVIEVLDTGKTRLQWYSAAPLPLSAAGWTG
jgi:hypothetical protein